MSVVLAIAGVLLAGAGSALVLSVLLVQHARGVLSDADRVIDGCRTDLQVIAVGARSRTPPRIATRTDPPAEALRTHTSRARGRCPSRVPRRRP